MSDNGGLPRLALTTLAKGVALVCGGIFTAGMVNSIIVNTSSHVKPIKRGNPCGVCKGIGFCPCKLCKRKSTIEWSPLYDPVVINPCLCPTCDGNRVQRCLNCLGKCYI